MNFKELAERIDKENNGAYVEIEKLADELSLEGDFYFIEQDRIKAYWIGQWTCTDTTVGYRLYFLDDEPICYSSQPARRSNEEFHWFSQELAQKTKDYIITLTPERELIIKTVSINGEAGNGYTIEFNGNMDFNKYSKIYLKENKERVEILERIKNVPYIDTHLKIKVLSTEEVKLADIKDLYFGFNTVD